MQILYKAQTSLIVIGLVCNPILKVAHPPLPSNAYLQSIIETQTICHAVKISILTWESTGNGSFLVPAVQLVEVLQRLYVSLSKTATWIH